MAKGSRSKFKTCLQSSAGTGHTYTFTSPSLIGKPPLKKYDPKVRKHVLYKAVKLK